MREPPTNRTRAPTPLVFGGNPFNRTPTRPISLPDEVKDHVYNTQAEAFRELLAPWGLADRELRPAFDRA